MEALSLEKAFGMSMETLMRMQSAYDIALARAKESEISVKPYVAKLQETPQSNPL